MNAMKSSVTSKWELYSAVDQWMKISGEPTAVICVHQNSYVEILLPKVLLFGDEQVMGIGLVIL